MSGGPLRVPGARAALTALAAASAALLVAACGASSGPGVAHLSSGNGSAPASSGSAGSAAAGATSAQQKLEAFSRCMRTHGVPNFPEPVEGRFEIAPGTLGGRGKGSGQFRSARGACGKLLPNGGVLSPQQQRERQELVLKVSACIRSHGVPDFPTPTVEGNHVRLNLKRGSGVDLRSPQFQSALAACRGYFGPQGGKGPPGAGTGIGAGGAPAIGP
ncbi:MAG: hypothetical protein KGJ43_04310 [Acidobacteriota bacterium]|nr:hypothetical protein [Acidobacteriota bacterium]